MAAPGSDPPLYPAHLEEHVTLTSGQIVSLRPIRTDDEEEHQDLLHHLTAQDSRWRFFATVKAMDHNAISRFTCIDYDREMAFIATHRLPDGKNQTLGVVRSVIFADTHEAEFAIVVRSEDKNHGLGWAMMQKMMRYLRERDIHRMFGEVLPDNHNMLTFVRSLGFESRFVAEDGVTKVWKDLS